MYIYIYMPLARDSSATLPSGNASRARVASVYICIYMCIYMYMIYMYMYMYICTYIYRCIWIGIQMQFGGLAMPQGFASLVYIYICIHRYVIDIYIYMYVYILIWYVYMYVCICMYTYTYAFRSGFKCNLAVWQCLKGYGRKVVAWGRGGVCILYI